jgi:hypothetical protein
MSSTGVTTACQFTCPKCRTVLPPADRLFELCEVTCTQCKASLEMSCFPALFVRPDTSAPGNIVSDQEAACYYHAGKQASEVCDHCGRFLCTLCSVDWHQSHLCPDCIRHARTRHKRSSGSISRTRYDLIALVIAILPALLFWPSLLSAPTTLFVVVFFWRKPCSFFEKRWHARARFITAMILALLQIAGWGTLISLLITEGFS